MAQKLKFGNGTWATKEGSTLAYNDENDRYKPLPFTTTRNSIATRVNKEGLIEVVGNDVPRIDYTDSADGVLLLEPQRTNLITYSEDFNNASWLKTNLNITKDIEIAPNGLLNASKILQTVSGGYARINTTLAGSETFSLFAKKGDLTDLKLFLGGDYSYFDLENGVVLLASGSTFVSSNIESFNNDWYRCSITSSYSGGTSIRFQGTNGTNDNSLGFIYTYGAQLEQGSYPTSYIPTNGSSVTRQADTASGAGNSEVFNDSEGALFADILIAENISANANISISKGINGQNLFKILYLQSEGKIRAELRDSTMNTIIDYSNFNLGEFSKVLLSYNSTTLKMYINGFEIGSEDVNGIPSGLNQIDFDRADGNAFFYGKTKEIGYYDTALTDEELEYMTSYRSLNELVTELNLNEL